MRVSFYFAVAFILASTLVTAQEKREQRWIERLKSTTVSSIEPGLPDVPFDQWFSKLVAPARAKYEVDDCGERGGSPDEKGKTFPLCVNVTAELSPARVVQLSLVVGTYVVPKSPSLSGGEKPAKVELFYGSIGPSDPRMKAPTQVIRKLSEAEKLLHRS